MSEEPKKKAKTGTLDWPIGVQVFMTAALITILLSALHFANKNDAVPEPEDKIFSSTKNQPVAADLPLPDVEWQDKRVLTTTPALAALATEAGAEAHCLTDSVPENSDLLLLTADQLEAASPFDVIVVADMTNRPPKQLARKVAPGGLLFVLDPEQAWQEYRETAGMLRATGER